MKDGQQKTRWVNVGVIGMSQNGKEYCLIDPTINFAGFPREAGKDMVMVGVFEDSQQGQQPQQQQQHPPQGQYGGQPPQQPQQQYGGQTPPPVSNTPVYDQNGQQIPV